jgi:hypothetical protein
VAGGFAAFELHRFAPGNLTAVGRRAPGGPALAHDTLIAAKPPAAVRCSVDVPSALTGTGSALLLDGHDAGLVRATIVDEDGVVVRSADNLVTFRVVTGPGRIAGVHNGDAKSHEPQLAASRRAYFGLVRAAVKVTHDTQSSALLQEIELDDRPSTGAAPPVADLKVGDGGITIGGGSWSGAMTIEVVATAAGLKPGKATIMVSSDKAAHGVMEVAGRDLTSELRFD